ncbi:Serine/threonine-protein kinase StkP [Aquisphaera giovannonii]|uniref:Serine/threonine-protein kinase StkP n=1 Tax=Aquisphaera giovannonii TaxID=406548 RepID=A0A5B9VW27_9BACT|nr:serine/threonine-protein kinase [Aquisphaera giovannonii]QEH32061.1 Serine/threonine-protein kinase StkP [Aquisphaera giovannonii]
MPVQVLCPNPRCGASLSGSGAELAGLNRCPRCGTSLGGSGVGAGAAAFAAPAGLAPGSAFGRYRVDRRLGEGGMGSVYLAHDTSLGRAVALKVPHLAAGGDPGVLERFRREAQAAAALDHPNLCPVYDAGEVEGVPYLTMAYIEGRPLSQLIGPERSLPQRQVAAVVRKLALALQEAHDRGVVHRDLKPANVLVSRKRDLVVVDFGLARREGGGDARLTRSGMIVGTPAYMAPEQVAGDASAVGPASDVYALGVILYEMVSGHVPFDGPAAMVLAQVMTAEPPPIAGWRDDADPELESVCRKATAKRRQDRYGSMREFAEALDGYIRGGRAASPSTTLADLPAAGGESPTPTTGAETLIGRLVGRLGPGAEPSEPMRVGEGPSAAASTREAKRPPTRRLPLVAAGASALAILLGLVLYVATGSGTVRIEVSDPKADVQVKVDGKAISVEGLGSPIRLSVGEHELEATSEGFEAYGRKFTIKRGEAATVLVELVSKRSVATVARTIPEEGGASVPSQPTVVPAAARTVAEGSSQPKPIGGDATRVRTPEPETHAADTAEIARRKAYADGIQSAQLMIKSHDLGGAGKALAACPEGLRGWEWYYCRSMCQEEPAVGRPRPREAGGDPRVGLLEFRPDGIPLGLSFSPNGKRLAYVTRSGELFVLDLTTRRPLGRRKLDRGAYRVRYSPDGGRIATIGYDKSGAVVEVWDARTLARSRVFEGHAGRLGGCILFGPNARWIATSCEGEDDSTVRIWPLSAGVGRNVCRGPRRVVYSLVADPAGRWLASVGAEPVVRFWDVATGRELFHLDVPGFARDCDCTPDGRQIALACFGFVAIMDVESRKLVGQFSSGNDEHFIKYSPDGRRLVTARSTDLRLEIWDPASGRELLRLDEDRFKGDCCMGLDFSADGRHIATSDGAYGTIRIWSIPEVRDGAGPTSPVGHDRGSSGGTTK